MIKNWFRSFVLSRPWLTFVVLGVSFFTFGAASLNLFFLFKANAQLLANYGWQAALDGGLQQLFELLFTGYVSMAAYVVFKACEHALVAHITDAPGEPGPQVAPPADARGAAAEPVAVPAADARAPGT